ncbi:MAG: HD-GYP domain-containing protein [Candidatus Cloacimonadales bacterium]
MSKEFKELPGYKEMRISPISLKFKDRDFEKEYALDYYNKSINQVRISFFLAIFLYGFLALLDTQLMPEYMYLVWVIRFSGVLPIGMLVLVSSFSESFEKVKSGAVGFAMFMFGFGIIMMIFVAPKPVDFSYYSALIITFIFIYLLTGFRFTTACFISFLLLIIYNIIAIFVIKTPTEILVKNNFFYIATNIIGMFGAYSLEFFSKRDYYIASMIDEQKKLLQNFNQELEFKVEEKTAELYSEIERRKQKEIELIESRAQLEKLYHETVAGLGAAVELRDPYTSGHQKNVSELALAIAQKLQLPKSDITAVTLAAKIHDIGKLVVPAIILNKEQELSADERMIMQGHTEEGYQLLKEIDFPWPIAEIVRQHHEKIDGSGYPRKLQGDEILIGAKIICVADLFETLTRDRPYRPAYGVQYAVETLKKGRGEIYESKIVDALLELIEQGQVDFLTK